MHQKIFCFLIGEYVNKLPKEPPNEWHSVCFHKEFRKEKHCKRQGPAVALVAQIFPELTQGFSEEKAIDGRQVQFQEEGVNNTKTRHKRREGGWLQFK